MRVSHCLLHRAPGVVPMISKPEEVCEPNSTGMHHSRRLGKGFEFRDISSFNTVTGLYDSLSGLFDLIIRIIDYWLGSFGFGHIRSRHGLFLFLFHVQDTSYLQVFRRGFLPLNDVFCHRFTAAHGICGPLDRFLWLYSSLFL